MLDDAYVFPHEDHVDHAAYAEQRKWLLSYAKRGGVVAEFGVFRAHFSEVIARELQPSRLYLVDPWTKFGERFNYGFGEPCPFTNYNKLTTAEAKIDAMHRMRRFGDSIVFVEDFEQKFCKNFNGKLDFVYLDSSHFYKDTIETLVLLDRILSCDGVIMGDDWYIEPDHYSGVCRAVNDFIRYFEYEIIVAGKELQFCIRRTANYTHDLQPKRRPSRAALKARWRGKLKTFCAVWLRSIGMRFSRGGGIFGLSASALRRLQRAHFPRLARRTAACCRRDLQGRSLPAPWENHAGCPRHST
jgi:hypothetical protein